MRILGFLAADRGPQLCTQGDLDLIITIAGYLAVAIDNARAYQTLEQFAQELERKVLERTEALQAANGKLRELNTLKPTFVSVVSHELRAPITSVKGYVENMLDGLTGTLTEKQSHYLSRIKFNLERLARMINDLLDLSRIEAGRVELEAATLMFPEVALEIVESLQPVAQAKAISLVCTDLSGSVKIIVDRDKLHQILINLIQNALKFTPRGGEIFVETCVRHDGYMQCCVSDTGCGISVQEQTKIFEQFYRGETVQGEQRGAGLGLAITKSLVELHGGTIWVESTPGQGSRFHFTIPTAKPQKREEGVAATLP